MATSRATIGSLFAAVQATANTAVSVVNAVNDGVSMINRTVDDMSRRQEVRSVADLADYEDNYIAAKAKETTEARLEIAKWAASENCEEEYQSSLNDLKTRIAALRAKRK